HLGSTPLMIAAMHGIPVIVQALLAQGADVNAKDKEGATALAIATERKKTEVVKLLQQAGARLK
ncbi:MAG TPA: ankyrin repeat domain-containing protein, partial [Terriglobia bacterium]|nr:ankyrin repeat domain-containing protein [Terriglobia bacterium]